MCAAVCLVGCTPSTPLYEEGRDTVQSFGKGRFQVCEGAPQSYDLMDEKARVALADNIVSWKQQGSYGYIIGKKPLRFYLIDIPAARLQLYKQLSQVPTNHQAVFKTMFAKNNAKSTPK